MFSYDYVPRGVCSRMIHIGLSDDGKTIEQVSFEGGCNGNLKAISKLVSGHPVDEICGILSGNTCGARKTSCADQLARGLEDAVSEAASAHADTSAPAHAAPAADTSAPARADARARA